MKSIRLNKELRAEIASNIEQAYVLKNKAPVLPNPIAELTEAVGQVYLKRVKVLKQRAEAVGLGKYLKETYYNYFNIAGDCYQITFKMIKGNTKQYLPQLNPESVTFVNFEDPNTDKELMDLYLAYKKSKKTERSKLLKHTEWVKAKANYMADVNNVLAGVNTTGQLLEVWEECEKFLPVGIVNPSKINLPSVNINQLNKCI